MYQKEIKQGNENIIFHSIYFTEDSFSIPDLTKITNMTFPTVKRVVNEFLEKDIIVEWTLSTGGVGRRAVKYKYNPDFCYSIGVSINEEKIKFILINTIGKIFQSKIIDTENENFIDFLTKNLKDFIEDLKLKLKILNLRVISDDLNKKIKKVALINGSAMNYWRKAKKEKVDLFITGDVGYHDALDALESGLNIIDFGHYESEHFFYEILIEELKDKNLEFLIFNRGPVFKFY